MKIGKRQRSTERNPSSRRARGAIAAVLLATVGALGLVSFVKGAEERALAGEELVDVLVVQERVRAGTPAEDLRGAVGSERVPAKTEAVGAVADLASLEGRVASIDLLPGEQITAERFVSADDFARTKGRIDVPEGLLEVTISLEPERAVGGVLRPGTTVGVVASFDGDATSTRSGGSGDGVVPPDSGRGANATHMILHKVLVTNVQSARSFEFEMGSGGEEERTETAPAPSESLLVTLALDAASVERLVFAAEHGEVWLAYEPPEAGEEGTRVLSGGAVFR